MKKEVYAKKKFGQNFLTDQNIISKILNIHQLEGNKILEIGPGRGALTKELVKQAKEVVAFEIDGDMINILNKEIASDNFKLFHMDFLESDISDFKDFLVIANIPYYITSDIIFKLLDYRQNFTAATLMVQKEVAERIIANKNSKEYSKLSVTVQSICTPKIEFIVKKTSFSPAPNVDSAIITLKFDKEKADFEKLKDFYKLCFLARRKKLSYSLKTKYSTEAIKNAFEKLGYDDNLRIQQLDIYEIDELYYLLENRTDNL
ncbi:16S rRNA (adenine(1518)-N(6)/adenine(1519)-N(6))-dimethyltransferase [Mycoplasmopsis pullorum]|uniref:16S rRNA (adenine(1518)-N(6)/adenine(1519)-N(6))- dimethyltransferase RsmA n=1 Tax=Mycoplasmopsis pullorum TaxID=48003 RepID=UPI001EE9E1D6|nr:16S rRNA (adenine(1518)-N(6)/adenine(1519)-N(6))-dimethyltransferase RsmA [Mycoplasmopsis pullorum]TNK83167.1 16S rRNA (adenine(1518)-N(6)/adenine(1519)-N(6))-dimethyltransferase [Mycoplasmopsis pullorum]TNK92197.1 16S rRNA (adenine(1518)-N(6)/adenine(1519)-N(6))-dimethyltransferase [Mycoplasmopsis pullorum]